MIIKKITLSLLSVVLVLPLTGNTLSVRANEEALPDLQLEEKYSNEEINITGEDVQNFNEFLTYAEIYTEQTSNPNARSMHSSIEVPDVEAYVNPVNDDEVIITVAGEGYTLYENNQDIYLKNSNGDELLISDVEIIDGPQDTTIIENDNPIATIAANGAYSLTNDKDYTTDQGPFKKSATHLISVMYYLSSSKKYRCDHPVLDAIYISVDFFHGLTSIYYQDAYLISYIKFWTAHKKTSLSYVREKQKWYYKKDFSSSSYLDTNTSYYYSSKPY